MPGAQGKSLSGGPRTTQISLLCTLIANKSYIDLLLINLSDFKINSKSYGKYTKLDSYKCRIWHPQSHHYNILAEATRT